MFAAEYKYITQNKKILAIFSTKIEFGDLYRKDSQVKYEKIHSRRYVKPALFKFHSDLFYSDLAIGSMKVHLAGRATPSNCICRSVGDSSCNAIQSL